MNSHATGWISHYKQHNVGIYSTSAPKLIVKMSPGISEIFIMINHRKRDRPTSFTFNSVWLYGNYHNNVIKR